MDYVIYGCCKIPRNYGTWNETVLEKDKAFAQEVHAHLQLVSKYV
jgi:hypothetical protein